MERIEINTGIPYQVLLGRHLLEHCGILIRKYAGLPEKAETAVIVTDDLVGELYAGKLAGILEQDGFRVLVYTIPHGEASKNLHTYAGLLEYMAENQVTRTDFLIALGGGMIGDLAGFAAATYLRKIKYIQIPTTLLAAVDSSVGGKTAVDLQNGKNLAGAFYQPALVICDLDTLDTLPAAVLTAGCAEVIKYGVLGDEKLFSHLERFSGEFDREYVVSRCIEIKRGIVAEDEFDLGQRQLLNLGHTLGHAAEQLSNYELAHGMAVSIGMAAVARAAEADGICSGECAGRILNVLRRFKLPVSCEYSMDELYEIICRDKKRKGDKISLVIPKRIGACEICSMTLSDMKLFLEKGL